MIKNQSDLATERERAYAAREAKQDKQFAKMMNTFAQLIPTPPKSTRKQTRRRKKSKSTDPKLDSGMDTSHADAKPPASSRPAQPQLHPPTVLSMTNLLLRRTLAYQTQNPTTPSSKILRRGLLHAHQPGGFTILRRAVFQKFHERIGAFIVLRFRLLIRLFRPRLPELANSSHRRALSKFPGLDAEVDSETSGQFRPSLGLDDRADSMANSVKY
jgi:hypothetical protein